MIGQCFWRGGSWHLSQRSFRPDTTALFQMLGHLSIQIISTLGIVLACAVTGVEANYWNMRHLVGLSISSFMTTVALAILNLRLPPLDSFILHLSATPKITTPILMTTIVYLPRLKARLQLCQGSPYTCHRIFLVVLILSVKHHDDTPYTNKTWAYLSHIVTQEYAFRLSCDGINLMERQVLLLLDWNVGVSERDLFTALMPLLAHPAADA
ncbi:PHO85 cyclin-1 like protein [Verticillium longisporum]|nr:PHO85 cyclin-1 like protein [Verticillium longisporum]